LQPKSRFLPSLGCKPGNLEQNRLHGRQKSLSNKNLPLM